MATLEEEKKKAQGFNRTFNAATDDPMNVSRARAASPLLGGAQNYDPATVGQPEPTGKPGAAWTKLGDALSYSDDRAAIAKRNQDAMLNKAIAQPATSSIVPPSASPTQASPTVPAAPAASTSIVPKKPGTITTDSVGNTPVNSYNGAANNESLARANAIRQQMIDSQPRGGSSILGGVDAQGRTRQERENDEKSARWRQDELISQAKYRPQMAGIAGAAIQGDAQQGVEETRQQGIMAGVGTQRRGQDIQAQAEAAKLAGNPADNALKTAQAKIAGIGADKAQAESSMLAEAQDPNTPPERRKALITSILAAQGKSPNENRYLSTPTKVYNEMGQVTGEEARVFDKESGQFIGGQAQQQAKQAPSSAVEFLKKNPNQAAAFKAKYGYLPEGFSA